MGAKTDSQLMRADKGRQRQQARAERRRPDRARVAVVAAQQLGITVWLLADAMRAGGVSTAITPTQAQRWASDPETAPQWLMQLLGERMAAAQRNTGGSTRPSSKNGACSPPNSPRWRR